MTGHVVWEWFRREFPETAHLYSPLFPGILARGLVLQSERPGLEFLVDPLFNEPPKTPDPKRINELIPDPKLERIKELIPDPLPSHSPHVVEETLQAVSRLLQLQNPGSCHWLDRFRGLLLVAHTRVARIDPDWTPPTLGLRTRVTEDGTVACWSPGGVWVALHVLVLRFEVSDLARRVVVFLDGDRSNNRADNLWVRSGLRVRSDLSQCRVSGALTICLLGQRYSGVVRHESPWHTLGRLLRRCPYHWTDARRNVFEEQLGGPAHKAQHVQEGGPPHRRRQRKRKPVHRDQ